MVLASRPVLGLAVILVVSGARAATFTVDSTADAPDAVLGDGLCQTASATCTLRAAVQEANALAGPDTVTVPAGLYLLTGTGLSVSQDLTITGAGAAATILDGGNAVTLLTASAPLTVGAVTLRHGFGSIGGAIQSLGANLVTVSDAIVEDNSAQTAGGGLAIMSIALERSIVRNNVSDVLGGGVVTNGGTVTASTFVGNSGGNGVFNGDQLLALGGLTLTVTNTTVVGQLGSVAFCMPPPFPSCTFGSNLVLNNVTTTALTNTGLNIGPGTITIANSIVGGCSGPIISAGYNLVPGPCSLSGDPTGNVLGVDPLLGPLQNNGGPTPTRMPGAPARNTANPAAPGSGGGACETADQRGVARPIGGRCDIGAVETACGDGVLDPGEACDDGNATSGDGCDANCAATGCGNGIVTAGEQCDDGNVASGDCCGATCLYEAAGSPCVGTVVQCTANVCNASGTCTNVPAPGPCEDGNPCTTGDTCSGTVCVPGPGCNLCLTCNPFVGCVPPSNTSCTPAAPAGASVTLRSGASDSVAFQWESVGPIDKTSFNDPVNVDASRLCVYDATGALVLRSEVPPGGTCPTRPCWKDKPTGFVYRDPETTPDGMRSLRLLAGTPGRIRAKGRGANLPLGPLSLVPPVIVRFEQGNDLGGEPCWSAVFGSDIRTNTATTFRARSD